MRDSPRSPASGYLAAVLAISVVVLLRLGLWEWFGDRAPNLWFIAAVTIAAWFGGLRPGLLATFLGVLAISYVSLPPVGTFLIESPRDLLGVVVFLGVGTLISHLGEGLHRMRAQQRASQQELAHEREAEEQLALAQEAGRMGSWQWDLRSNRLSWSPGLEALHGLPPGKFPPSLAAYQDTVHPADRGQLRQAFEETIRLGQDYSIEYRVVWPAGTVRWLEGRGRLFRDSSGAPTRMIAVCIDITDRKRAESAFLESEHRFGGFMQHLPGLAWIKDLAGRYIYANDAAVRAFAIPREQLYGRTDQEIFPPERAAEFRHNDRLALESPGGYQAVETLLHDDGVLHYSVVNKFAVPGPDGRPGIIGGIAIDITENKRADAELQKQNVRLMLLGEAASLLLVSDSVDDMMQGLFRTIQAHLGLEMFAHYVVNEKGDGLRLVSWGGLSDEQAREFAELRLGEAVSGSVALERRPIETAFVQRSEEPRDQKARQSGLTAYACYPLLTEGRLIGTLNFGSRSREQLSADDLGFLRTVSRYVTVATERLRLIEQLRDADRRKDEFLATLAHELRNPLAPIRNALEIQRRSEHDRARMDLARSMMERQLEQLVRLIDDLLDVSRITRGKLELRTEVVELATVLQRAVEANRSLIDDNQHRLILSLPEEPVHLQADLARLTQVFQNLLNNAAKYTDPGGKLWCTASAIDHEVVVKVRDNGVGIPADMLGTVFEMFAQVNRPLERAQEGGLGIGLTLVKRLVEMHGGTVSVRSDGVGRGSEFTVRLPRVSAPKPGPAETGVSSLARGTRRRVLVADDNRESAESLALMLELMGNEVHVARDGDEAIRLAEVVHPEVVVLDIGMPKVNGYDAARSIRAYPWGRSVLLIALTGWGQQTDKNRSEAAGFDHHLVKPVDPGQLERLLATDHDALQLEPP